MNRYGYAIQYSIHSHKWRTDMISDAGILIGVGSSLWLGEGGGVVVRTHAELHCS